MTDQELKQIGEFIGTSLVYCTKAVLTANEAAAYLGVSLSCLYKWTMNRTIPHFKPNGKLVYFEREELEKVIAKKAKKYPDEQKLIQYLMRQGFNYSDILDELSAGSSL